MRDSSKQGRRWETASCTSGDSDGSREDHVRARPSPGDFSVDFASLSVEELENRLRHVQTDLFKASEARDFSSANALRKQMADLLDALEGREN